MGAALCTACGAEFGWRNGRGTRLADVRSSCCGARAEAMRYARRVSILARIARFGSLAPPDEWQWRESVEDVYLLTGGDIQLANRAIYTFDRVSDGMRYLKYAGDDPYIVDYGLRMREYDYRLLVARGVAA